MTNSTIWPFVAGGERNITGTDSGNDVATMPPTDLRHFIDLIESRGELTRIAVEADPLLEIAAITDQVCKEPASPALLFEKPCGASFPVATNLFGSPARVASALGLDTTGQLTDRMSSLLDQLDISDLQFLDRSISALPLYTGFRPHSESPLWQSLPHESDLSIFPFLQNFPGDGSASGNPRYITLPQVFTADPFGNNPNCGIYRAQVSGTRELAIRWKEGSGAACHLEAFRQLGRPMPVAIALGGPPAVLLSAMMPLPGDLDEITFAGFLCGTPIGMSACRTIPLQVPGHAEVVIEGYVDPTETVMEGPFGNHTGFYSAPGPAPLMRVTAISCREDAIIPATVVGRPPMEDCWMAQAWERVLLSLIRKLMPQVADIYFPPEWTFQQSAIISLEHPQPGMVSEIAHRIWDLPWFRDSRLLIFVAAGEQPIQSDIAWRCINLAEFSHDLILDTGRKRMALDATGCRCAGRQAVRDTAMMQRVLQRWQEYGIP
jgi:4-hydroxy-3-polyprenylbenzoate decarboxylase